jgi:hypothetical protein
LKSHRVPQGISRCCCATEEAKHGRNPSKENFL